MTQAASQAMTGTQPPGGIPRIGTEPPGVLLGTVDTPFESNMRIYNAGQTDRCFMNAGRTPNEGIYNFNDGNIAGDRMALEWRWMPCVDIWRGMGKGELRPAIDIKKVKKMLEKREYNPDTRFNDDRRENNGIPVFVLNEYKQTYMEMQWKHNA